MSSTPSPTLDVLSSFPDFQPLPLLRNPHVQTLLGHFLGRPPLRRPSREHVLRLPPRATPSLLSPPPCPRARPPPPLRELLPPPPGGRAQAAPALLPRPAPAPLPPPHDPAPVRRPVHGAALRLRRRPRLLSQGLGPA